MTGDIEVDSNIVTSGNIDAATGTVTADSFSGDGTLLSGVVKDNGDEMSGALGIADNTATASLYVYKTGASNQAAYLETNSAGNSADVLYAKTAGTGSLIGGDHTGASGDLIRLDNGGNVAFAVDKAGNTFASGTVNATNGLTVSGGTVSLPAGEIDDTELSPTADIMKAGATIFIDGNGSAITTGEKKYYISWPYNCTITKVRVLADQSSNTTVDVWNDSYANFPPTDADSLFDAAAEPALAGTVKAEVTSFDGGEDSIAQGDITMIRVDANDSATLLSITFEVTRQ